MTQGLGELTAPWKAARTFDSAAMVSGAIIDGMRLVRWHVVGSRALGLVMISALGCGDDSRPAGVGPAGCVGAICPAQDGGTDAEGPSPDAANDADAADNADATDGTDAADELAPDVGHDAYDGPTGALTGTIFLTSPPIFPVERGGEYPLSFPASVSVWAYGAEVTAGYDPAAGYSLSGVPVGSWTLLVRDNEDKENGVLDSAVDVTVAEGANSRDIAVIGRNSFVVIYGGLTPPIIRDPALAQVVMTFESCAAEGGERLAGVKVQAPAGGQGVLYHNGGAWELEAATGTSDYGVAILVNLPATEYPGEKVGGSYVYDGQSYAIPEFAVFRGGVIRVVVVHPC